MNNTELARSSAAHKAWATRRANTKQAVTALDNSRSNAANKAWATRRANAKTPVTDSLIASLRPTATTNTRTNDSLTKGLRKREITAKTVVEKIKAATSLEYYSGTDRSVIVMYSK